MIRPAPRRHWALLGLMALACLLATMGLTLHWRWLGILSLVMLAVGVIGMAMVFKTLRREVVERERLLRELNEMLDEQVQARTARLMQTIESLESFNRMVSHDLRSPMTSMMSGLDALSYHLEQEPPELLHARISKLEGEVSRMAN
ncbi:MAG: hypothetical protein LWX11_00255, partial [Firmicutes bacterium]|nr:hypothetical protein [Bacillota bacterium]